VSDQPDSLSFNKNYKILKDTADWLSQQKEPDIDQLVPKVEIAMQAYKVCKTRLDSVQATLSQYFESDGTTATEEASAPVENGIQRYKRPTTSVDSPDEEGGDIPF
jgi:exodeoxyribonuclease VII small subunit